MYPACYFQPRDWLINSPHTGIIIIVTCSLYSPLYNHRYWAELYESEIDANRLSSIWVDYLNYSIVLNLLYERLNRIELDLLHLCIHFTVWEGYSCCIQLSTLGSSKDGILQHKQTRGLVCSRLKIISLNTSTMTFAKLFDCFPDIVYIGEVHTIKSIRIQSRYWSSFVCV